LLHPGALAFELWFDRPAPLAAMRGAGDSRHDNNSKDKAWLLDELNTVLAT
jgi:Shikimate 5'-dehydrogenase C-terminal domain